MYELFDDQKRHRAGSYLQRFETKGGIYRFLKDQLGRVERTPLQDKALFAARCRERGLPVVTDIFVAKKGVPGSTVLPGADLFIKPIGGRGGCGAERWDHIGSGRFRNVHGEVLTAAKLLDHIRAISTAEDCVIQPRLTNRREMADLSNGALATARIVTMENERGGHEVTDAVLRMAVGENTTVDNFHAGGIAARIDVATGELGAATDVGLRPDRGWCDRHPDTGAVIRGRRLPIWQETTDLVCRAHAAFADRVVIGWDVAITDDGPVLIEGNGAPDVDIHQRVSGVPLGQTRFGELLAYHVRRAIAVRETRRQQATT
jgi:hypothetical protein